MTDATPPSSSSGSPQTEVDHAVYDEIAHRDDFTELRRRYTSFAFPATAAFMIWYIAYVVANNWARDFMNMKVIGHVNVALVWGLLQFVSTFLIAFLYSRHANKELDPLAGKLREEFDERTGR
jgi:uncharacterized membrane protein (DUF485 family)